MNRHDTRGGDCGQQVEKGNIRLKGDLGGGTLYDIGIYCINAARYLFREEPVEVFAFSARGRDSRFAERLLPAPARPRNSSSLRSASPSWSA